MLIKKMLINIFKTIMNINIKNVLAHESWAHRSLNQAKKNSTKIQETFSLKWREKN